MTIKTKKQLLKRLNFLDDSFQKNIHNKAVTAVNEYLEHNKPFFKSEVICTKEVECIVDNLCLTGAWIYDRLQGKICTTHHKNYNGSLTKKIRKALGFTY